MTFFRPSRLFLALAAACALPGIAACQQEAPAEGKADARPAKPEDAAPVNFERETPAFAFTYAYPPAAKALPKLVAILESERDAALAELEKQATEAQQDAKANDYPFNPHMLGISWTTTGDNAQLLAMMAEISSFSGGAHGNTGYDALIWDKKAERRITLADAFTNGAAALEPMRQAYCDALNGERMTRRGEIIGEADDMFNTCPPFSDLAVVPYSGGDGSFDRIMFVAAPYVAGPYAEGIYEISIALPQAALDKVKPEYRGAFIAIER